VPGEMLMLQVYFLLVVSNIVVGLMLGASFFRDRFSSEFFTAIQNRSVQKSFGLIAVLIGFFGLIAVLPDDLPILGNLLPALSSIIVGLALFIGEPSDEIVLPPWAELAHQFIYHNNGIISIIAIVFGILHFIFPTALFL